MLIRGNRGVTVIELMIGLLLFSVVLMLAFPNFTTMMHNMKLRTQAESILAGLHAARSEALKRNQTVQFLLTADDPDPANVAAFVANAAGPSWAVRAIDPLTGPAFVEGHSGLEGSNQTNPAALNVQIAAANLPAGNAIQFNELGRVTGLGANVEINVTNPTGGACKTTAGSEPMRCLRIVITPGGRVRMCDPSVAPVAGDTRAC